MQPDRSAADPLGEVRGGLGSGAANCDERKYPDPDRFDRGEHACIGMNLARMEMRALLEALLPRVGRFELLASALKINNTLRGLGTCTVRVS